MSYDPVFARTVEILLTGNVVCQVSSEREHQFLSQDANRERVEHHLGLMGRGLAQTRDLSGFYATYRHLDANARRIITEQFKQAAQQWEALLHWMRISRQVSPNGRPLAPGDVIQESAWLSAIENSSGLQTEMDTLAARFGLRGKSQDPKDRLRNLLDRLQKMGFLEPIGGSGAMFRATARWSLIREQLEFVRQYEGIVAEERTEEAQTATQQRELLDGTQ